MAFGELSW